MKGHIIYMSLRFISKGEELTIDYNYDRRMKPCAACAELRVAAASLIAMNEVMSAGWQVGSSRHGSSADYS